MHFFRERQAYPISASQHLNQNPFMSTGIYEKDQRFKPKLKKVSEYI